MTPTERVRWTCIHHDMPSWVDTTLTWRIRTIAMTVPVSATTEPERVVFHADHPFVYVIRDVATGVALFAARVTVPERSG